MEKTSKHPRGLYILSLSSVAERFSYYGMRAVLVLFISSCLFSQKTTVELYGCFAGLVYLTPLLGGYLAGRYLGERRSIVLGGIIMAIGHFLLFFSGLTAQQSIFVENGPIMQSVDNFLPKVLLFCGLALLVIGTGFYKPTSSSLVGALYEPSDKRIDDAYTIFYMGVNAGALVAPLVCGLFESDWSNPGRFKWAFLVAACVMVASVVQFLLMQRGVTGPGGELVGEAPKRSTERHDARESETFDMPFISKAVCVILGLVLIALFGIGAKSASDWISAVIYSFCIVVPLSIVLDRKLTRVERMRILVIYVIVAFGVVFWSFYEQAGCALTLFAKENVDCNIGGWNMPSVWLQSVNPVCVVAFAPVMVMLWKWLSKHGLEPSSITKQAIGILLLALGYAVMVYATKGMSPTSKVAILWIIMLYWLHSIGELALSPIGMSLVNKLSPARLASLMMGVWFLSSAAAGVIAGKLSTLLPQPGQPASVIMGYSIETFSDFFLVFVVLGGVAGIVLALLNPILKRMSGGIL